MRDLVFKNLTSKDRKKKILSAKEIINENGILTRINKHLIYIVREATGQNPEDTKIQNELFIIKEKKSNQRKESFFVKMKGGMYTNQGNKLFVVNFLHSLKIELYPTHQTTQS